MALGDGNKYKAGGSEEIRLDELAPPAEDSTATIASPTAPGLMRKLSGNANEFLRGDGTFGPAGGGGPHTHPQSEVVGLVTDLAAKVAGNDPRLSDSRPPAPHTHPPGEITGTAVVTTDPRLTDARTPLAHAHSVASLTGYPGGTANFLRADGTFAPPPGGGSGYRTLVTLALDVPSLAVLTFQNITGLSFPVLAGVNYRFYALILYTTSVATIGLRVSLTGPTMTHLAYTTRTGITATGSAGVTEWANYQATQDAGTSSTASISTTAGNLIVLEGICRPSAPGTVQCRFAPETATLNGVVIKAGSTVEVW